MLIVDNLYRLIFPNICVGCAESAPLNYHLCEKCLHDLPYTYWNQLEENEIVDRMLGKHSVIQSYSLLYYESNELTKNILHGLKYLEKQELGELMAKQLKMQFDKYNLEWSSSIDAVVPIPLHPKKLKNRGYNQVDLYAKKVCELFELPLDNKSVIRVKNTKTQTKLSKLSRLNNLKEAFTISEEMRDKPKKHILLIDDVMTTGATMESCILGITKHWNDCNFSVLTIAIAD